jgi:oligopeptidase B
MQNKQTTLPQAEKIDKLLKIHNHTRLDPYYWLRNSESAKTLAYLNAENAYRESEMKHTEALQKTLFEEIKGRIKEDDQSVPYKKHGYWYYVRFEAGQEHPIYCRKKGSLKTDEEILIDANVEAKNHSYYQIGGLSISPNNQWLAFGVDTLSRRIYKLYFKHLPSGEVLDYNLDYTTGSCAWSTTGDYVFYTVKDASLRPHKIFRHKLKSPVTTDVEIFHEQDETFVCSVYKSKSEAFIMIGSHSTLANEYQFTSAEEPTQDFKILQTRERHLEYGVAHYNQHWYIRTNKDGAENFKLMRCPIDQTQKEFWQDVIPHRKKVYLEGLEIFNDYLILEERENGLSCLRIKRWDNTEDYYLSFDSETYTCGIGNNPDFKSTTLRYGYSSLTTPTSVVDYDLVNRTKEIKKQVEVVGGYQEEKYAADRLWATAPDRTEVPISLVYRKDLRQPTGNPLLLYGYGSYGHTIDPNFSSVRLSLLDRGFVFAIAHVRGGQYLGRNWYEQGKMLNKKNTFTDFIACGEHLIKEGFTSSKKLYAMGGSAGGLLIGAVVNIKPEIFAGAIAAVPFVDVVTTMLDETIPLTTGEYDEWGNPNHEEYYHYMKEYSPYDNVEAKDYPPLLITTGLHDSQVQYWEPAKWCARLRELKTDKNPLFMYINMDSGHGGASGRFEAFKETAMEYAFLLDLAEQNESS